MWNLARFIFSAVVSSFLLVGARPAFSFEPPKTSSDGTLQAKSDSGTEGDEDSENPESGGEDGEVSPPAAKRPPLLEPLTERMSLLGCGFSARNPSLPFLNQNWANEVTGAEFLTEIPEVRSADFQNQALALIDTGLKLGGNPDAGSRLLAASLESDDEGHGTQLAAIAASEKFGVNPWLRVLPFSVRYDRNRLSHLTFGFLGHPELLNALTLAIADPHVSVVLLPVSPVDDPALVALIREAIRGGKWVVFPAGGRENHLPDDVRNAVFYSGGVNYFLTPDLRLEGSSQAVWFAPASRVSTLNPDYRASVLNSRRTTEVSGPAVAAVQLAAILATLRGLSPRLNPLEAKRILELSSIHKKEGFPIAVLNVWHATRLLLDAMKCANTKSSSDLNECLALSEIEIQKSLLVPNPPTGSECAAWVAYYRDLKRSYALAADNSLIGDALDSFFLRARLSEVVPNEAAPSAETFYFGRQSGSTSPPVAKFNNPILASDWKSAVSYFATKSPVEKREGDGGERKMASEAKDLDAAVPLANLPTGIDRIPIWLDRCHGYFYATPTIGSVLAKECEWNLGNAPLTFRTALAQKIKQQAIPLGSHRPLGCLLENKDPLLLEFRNIQGTGEIEDPRDAKVYQDLLSLAIRGWSEKGEPRELWALYTRMGAMKESDRLFLLEQFEAKKNTNQFAAFTPENAAGKTVRADEMELLLLSWAPKDRLGQKKDEVRKQMGNLPFAVRRWKAGYETYPAVLSELKKMVFAHPPEVTETSLQGNTLGRFSKETLNSILSDAKLTEAFAELLRDLPTDSSFIGDSSKDLEVVDSILRDISTETAEPLFQSVFLRWMKRGRLGDTQFYDFFYEHRNLKAASEIIKKISEGPQLDSDWQQLRLGYLLKSAENSEKVTPVVERFLEEYPGAVDNHLLDLAPGVIRSQPELFNAFRLRLRKSINGEKAFSPTPYFRLVTSSDSGDYAKFARPIASAFQRLARESKGLWLDSLQQTVQKILDFSGSDIRVIEALVDEMSELLENKAFSERGFQARTADAVRSVASLNGESFVMQSLLAISQTQAGESALRGEPALVDKMVAFFLKNPNWDPLYSGDYQRLSPLMKAELLKQMPEGDLAKAEQNFSPWMERLMIQDERAFDRGVRYWELWERASNRKEPPLKLRSALVRSVQNEAQRAEIVLSRCQDLDLKEEVRSWMQ